MKRYSIAVLKNAACPILGVEFDDVIAHSTLTGQGREEIDLGVSDSDFVAIWRAMVEISAAAYDPIFLGKMMANGPIVPIFLAFSCAPNLKIGLERFSRYKSLFGPIVLQVDVNKIGISVEIRPEGGEIDLPPSMVAPFVVFFVEKARSHSARHIIPARVTCPPGPINDDIAREYFGCTPLNGRYARIEFSTQDMQRSFVSENAEIWQGIELDLQKRVDERARDWAFNMEVETAIRSSLYGGHTHVDAICRQLGVSRSTLQRRLAKEGFRFQQVFDRVRVDLATRYLTKSAFSVSEIASLVGYRDPKSFHRTFKKWFSMTPETYRSVHRR
ncbi:MAG: helix-turn-helix domain-containing protein [Pseudomonadota bacterium]